MDSILTIQDEAELRYTLGIDFLTTLIDENGRFDTLFEEGESKGKKSNLTHTLHAISTLYTSRFFNKKKAYQLADESFDTILSTHSFEKDSIKILLDGEESETNVNAFAAIIFHKLNRIEEGIPYINSVLKCVRKKKVTTYYEPATDPKIIEENSHVHANHGLVTIALMQYYRAIKDRKYLDAAKRTLSIVLSSKPKMHPYYLWALVPFKTFSMSQKYAKQVEKYIDSRYPEALTGTVAGILQESNIAIRRIIGKDTKLEEIFKRQAELQVDMDYAHNLDLMRFQGAFVRSQQSNLVRIDTLLFNIMSFLHIINDRYDPV